MGRKDAMAAQLPVDQYRKKIGQSQQKRASKSMKEQRSADEQLKSRSLVSDVLLPLAGLLLLLLLSSQRLLAKLLKRFKSVEAAATATATSSSAADAAAPADFEPPTFNEVGIQLLSRDLQRALFGGQEGAGGSRDASKRQRPPPAAAVAHLKRHGIPLEQSLASASAGSHASGGAGIEEHFRRIAEEQVAPYRRLIDALASARTSKAGPPAKDAWPMPSGPGWHRLLCSGNSAAAARLEPVTCPGGDAFVFDTENVLAVGQAPVMAHLVPMYGPGDDPDRPRLIAGHFVAFDRAKIKEEYSLQRTLKLMAKRGRFANKRWAEYQRDRKQRGADSVDEDNFGRLAWVSDSALNNLADVFALCTGEDAEADAKLELRDYFVSGSLADVRDRLRKLLAYCARDVWMTHRVLARQWKDFDKHFPSPDGQRQTLQRLADEAVKKFANGGHELDPWLWDLDWSVGKSKTGLPKWYRDLVPKPVEKNAAQGASLITAQMRVAPKLLRLTWRGFPLHHDSELKWGRLVPGRNPSPAEADPRYFNPDNGRLLSDQPAIKTVAAGSSELRFPLAAYCRACLPSLLRCLRQHELLDQQQQRRRQRQAWWRRFSADLAGSLRMLPVDEIGRAELEAALTAMESGAAGDDGEGGREAGKEEYDWERHLPCALTATPLAEGAAFKRAANPSIDACWFCALPHPQGTSVGNPLSKSFLAAIDAGLLCSDRPEVGELLRMHARCTYWQGASKRVNSQLALPLVHGGEGGGIRLILPQVVAMGTVSRRAVEPLWLTASNARPDRLGSELKAMVQPPPGYRLVGADVDSQELWIASMAGDAEFDDDVGGGNGERRRIHGATAVSWMSLRGSKAEGTDLHSVSARLINVSREHAKVLNYARFYGSGAGNIAKLLCQFDPGIDKQLAMDKARKLLRETKGSRSGGVWRGGSESFLFNHMERIAGLQSPRTPFLGAALSCALRAGSTGGDFATSRINWVIQSSAVDYLHCLLVACRWLTAKYGIDARFAISIHDEVRYLVRDSDTMRFALALQLANLLTRAFFASRLGFRDLPQSVAFFSGVDIDSCMRKDPLDDCVTPSNSAGLRLEYGIEPGVTLDIEKILQATGGRLDKSA
uniref:DNA-directed DNA polymerase n=1 Tax=Macrostomum lignano TaxID=282301 RepID=A0A1I8GAC5_9PLAT